MKRGANSPWHNQSGCTPGPDVHADLAEPAGPTRWELMLAKLELGEDEAIVLMRSNIAGLAPRARSIERWVRLYARHCFVPEQVLSACGIGEDDKGSLLGVPKRRRMAARVPCMEEEERLA